MGGILLVGLPQIVVGQELLLENTAASDGDFLQRLQDLELQVQQMRQAGSAATAESPPQPVAPQYPQARLTGFFQLDWGFYSQDAENRATLGDIDDSLGFRRSRIAATGNVSEKTSYIIEFDIAQAQARFVDVWMEFAETPLGKLRIGRYRQPYGMTELTGIRDLPFIERPLLFGLDVFFRQTGAMLTNTFAEEQVTWAVSGFRYLSDNFGNVYSDSGGYGFATRITCLPIDLGESLLHLGADYAYKDPGRGLVQLANTNEFFGGQNPILGAGGLSVLPIVNVPAFVNTGPISTRREQTFNVEAAATNGPVVLQSEARWAVIEDDTGVVNTFPGVYAHVRWMLTGETIPYNRSTGVFGRVKPDRPVDFLNGAWGAWEIAARVSYLDLNGTNLVGPGRRLTDSTIGVNWYINNNTKFQFNWIDANLNDPTLGGSRADTFAIRGQLDF